MRRAAIRLPHFRAGNALASPRRDLLDSFARGIELSTFVLIFDAGVDDDGHAAFYFSIGHRSRDGGP